MMSHFVLQCGVLKEKLDSLLKTLNEESQASSLLPPAPPPTIAEEQEELEVAGLPPPLHPAPPSHPTCSPRTTPPPSTAAAIFKPREQLMLRANSLKKAIRQIIEHTEKGGSPAGGGQFILLVRVTECVFMLQLWTSRTLRPSNRRTCSPWVRLSRRWVWWKKRMRKSVTRIRRPCSRPLVPSCVAAAEVRGGSSGQVRLGLDTAAHLFLSIHSQQDAM